MYSILIMFNFSLKFFPGHFCSIFAQSNQFSNNANSLNDLPTQERNVQLLVYELGF